jgi:hypothetical protein
VRKEDAADEVMSIYIWHEPVAYMIPRALGFIMDGILGFGERAGRSGGWKASFFRYLECFFLSWPSCPMMGMFVQKFGFQRFGFLLYYYHAAFPSGLGKSCEYLWLDQPGFPLFVLRPRFCFSIGVYVCGRGGLLYE